MRPTIIHFLYYFCFVYLLVGCVSSSNDKLCEQEQQCIIYGITSDILILDPHVSDSIDAGIIFRQIYDTLVYRDNNTGEFIGGLAQSWEISDDGLAYKFNLRNNVSFHDGTQFTAESVASNIDRIFEATINSQKARLLLGPFSRYEITDSYTITFYLFEPYMPFLDGLAQPYLGMASPDSFKQYSNLRYQFHQVGTGPFILDEYLPGDRIELSRNPNYKWAPSIYNTPDGKVLNRIVFKIITDSSSRSESLLNGVVDVIDKIRPADARNLSNNSSIQILPTIIPGQTVQFYMNTSKIHTDSLLVRQALLYATNRIAINDSIFLNFSSVAWSPLSASTQYEHTGFTNEYLYNLDLASQLLQEAGYIDSDDDGFVDLDGIKLEITMLVPPWGQLPEIADFLRTQWRSIGIDLVINPVPGFNSLINQIQSDEYNLVSFDTFGLDPSILVGNFLSSSINNTTRYQNEELDRILLQANQERDSFTRRSQYFQIQSIIMNDALIIPIREYVNINLVSSNIQNLQFDAYGWYPLLYDARLIE